MNVWYLYHSGFAVKTEGHFLIFDYYRSAPAGKGLESGVIDPAALAGEKVLAFASHAHGDHYNPVILRWRDQIPGIRYILSDDIRPVPGAIMVGAGETRSEPDFTLETLASTDEGVAFLLEIDGKRIYHAGDLNWWHWAGETEQYNRDMEQNYKRELEKLKGKPIDLAFVPVDPRLEDQYSWGIDCLMRSADVRRAVPMHFGDDDSVVARLLRDPVSAPYRDRILPMTSRGQCADIE